MTHLILGRRENGKTTLAIYMAGKVPRRLILDPRAQIRRPGALVVRTLEQLETGMLSLAAGDVSEVVFSPVDQDFISTFEGFTAEVRNWVIEHPRVPLAVVIDESSFYELETESLMWSLKCCRRDTIHFFFTAHRPSDYPVNLRAIADFWFVFPVTQEHDLEVLSKRCSAAVVAKVQQLPDREYVLWNDTNGTHQLGDDPSAWRVALAPGGAIEAA